MVSKKRIIKIPKVVSIKCLHCSVISKRKVPLDSSPQLFICDKCNREMRTPITSCCVICAFSGKKCAPSLIMEAKVKGLEIR